MDALTFALLLMALGLGLAAGWIWARARAAAESAAAAETARAEQARLTAELAAATSERDRLATELRVWQSAAEQSKQSEEQLRAAAEARFAQLSQVALKEQGTASGKALADLLQPFREKLDKLESETRALERARTDAYATLTEKLGSLQGVTAALQSSSLALATALKGDARARGRWGEVALRNIAEFAGMTPHCDFSEQETADDGSRPDMIVNMPGGEGRIPIDAKVPMDAYMIGIEATDPDARRVAFLKHAQDMRKHVRTLAGRDYAQSLGSRVDYTIMFIPADPVLSAAFEADPTLQQESMEKRVLLATPVTLVALLRTVAMYWQHTTMAENAKAVCDAAREFNARVGTFADHLQKVGRGLKSALDNYDSAVGSYERMVLPQGRRLEELGAVGQEAALPDLEVIGRSPRVLQPSPTPLLDRTVGPPAP